MTLAILLANKQYSTRCSCGECKNLCSCNKCKNEITLYGRIMNTVNIVHTIYETGSLYKTKGSDNNIMNHYITQFYTSIRDKIRCAIYLKQHNCIPALKPLRINYLYNTTYFSWPTRNRVFNIMSNPASSMFLQNATSSLHISTKSNPSFPRIL
jgi:hypothetical protein